VLHKKEIETKKLKDLIRDKYGEQAEQVLADVCKLVDCNEDLLQGKHICCPFDTTDSAFYQVVLDRFGYVPLLSNEQWDWEVLCLRLKALQEKYGDNLVVLTNPPFSWLRRKLLPFLLTQGIQFVMVAPFTTTDFFTSKKWKPYLPKMAMVDYKINQFIFPDGSLSKPNNTMIISTLPVANPDPEARHPKTRDTQKYNDVQLNDRTPLKKVSLSTAVHPFVYEHYVIVDSIHPPGVFTYAMVQRRRDYAI